MTLISSIIEEVRANVNEDSTVVEKFYANSEIINYIKRSINDICIDTDSNYSIDSLDVAGSTVGNITSINCSATVNITLATHGLDDNDTVYISGVTGTVASYVNDNYWEIAYVDANNFTITLDASDYAYTANGSVKKMVKVYTFASINTTLLDLRFLVYRDVDWTEWLYDDLVKTDPRTGSSYTAPSLRRQTCYTTPTYLVLNKAPKIGDQIVVAGKWLPTQITTSGDTYPLGVIEEDATIKYVTSMCWLKKNKPEIATAWMGLYNERKQDIEKKFKKMTQADYPSALSIYKKNDSLLDLVLRIPDTIGA